MEELTVKAWATRRFRPIIQLMDNAKYAEALDRLDGLLPELKPEERSAALYWKVICLSSLTEWRRARECVEQALAQVDMRNPLRTCLELENAYLQHNEDDPNTAAADIQAILDRHGEELKSSDSLGVYVQAKTNLGNLLVNAGRYEEAVGNLEEALSLQGQPLSSYYIHFWLGIAKHQLGRASEARKHLESAITEANSVPKAGLIPYYAARIRYELALIAYEEHRFDDVLRQSELALAVGLQDPELLRVIGRLKDLVDKASAQ